LWAFIAKKNDKVSEELTLRYPPEGPCVGPDVRRGGLARQTGIAAQSGQGFAVRADALSVSVSHTHTQTLSSSLYLSLTHSLALSHSLPLSLTHFLSFSLTHKISLSLPGVACKGG